MNAEAGAAGMVTLFGVVLLVVLATAGIAAAGDLAVTAARARAAADAAALAGIGTSPLVASAEHGPADAAAGAVARANDARLVAGDSTRWPLRYGVTVAVEPATRWVRRFVGSVRAEAVAAVRPRVPTSGRSGV